MNENWYARNAVRLYPMDDTATSVDDAGQDIPLGVVADCRVVMPFDLAPEVWISGLTVTDNLVAMVLVQNKDNPQAIASLTLPQPLTPMRTYWMKSLLPGVTATVAFGDPNLRYVGRCSTYAQSKLLANCLIRYRPAAVTSIKKRGLATALSGSVKLEGIGRLLTQTTRVFVDDTSYPAIVFRLADNINKVAVMEEMAGPCAKRPDSDTCDRNPIETIGGVFPDCNGSIGLQVIGAETEELTKEDGVGVALYHPVGLTALCAKINKTVIGEDECNPEPPIDLTFPSISSISIGGESGAPCADLPYSGDLDEENPEFWEVISGNFSNGFGGFYSDCITPNYPIGGAILHSCHDQAAINRNLSMVHQAINPNVSGSAFFLRVFTGFIIGWRPYGEFYAVGSSLTYINGTRATSLPPLFDIEVRKFLHLPPTGTQESRIALSGAPLATTVTAADLQQRQLNDLYRTPLTAEEVAAISDIQSGISLEVVMTQQQNTTGGTTKTRLAIQQTRASGRIKTLSLDISNIDSPIPYSKFGVLQWQGQGAISSFSISNPAP